MRNAKIWILQNEKKSGICEMKKIWNLRNEKNLEFAKWKKIWNLRNEPIARNSTDCMLSVEISKIVIRSKYNSQVTNYNVCLFHGTIKNGIKSWHILLNILILCEKSLAKPHCKFFSEPRKKLYGNQSQFRFLSQLHWPRPISSSLDFFVPQHKPCCSSLNLESYTL